MLKLVQPTVCASFQISPVLGSMPPNGPLVTMAEVPFAVSINWASIQDVILPPSLSKTRMIKFALLPGRTPGTVVVAPNTKPAGNALPAAVRKVVVANRLRLFGSVTLEGPAKIWNV